MRALKDVYTRFLRILQCLPFSKGMCNKIACQVFLFDFVFLCRDSA